MRSPSTVDADCGETLHFYKALLTLRRSVLVYQDQMRAEHRRRTSAGWSSEALIRPDDGPDFETIRFRLARGHVHFAAGVPAVAAASAPEAG